MSLVKDLLRTWVIDAVEKVHKYGLDRYGPIASSLPASNSPFTGTLISGREETNPTDISIYVRWLLGAYKLTGNRKYLEWAKETVDDTLDLCLTENMVVSYNIVTDSPENFYSVRWNARFCEALSDYAELSGESEYRETARSILETVLDRFVQPSTGLPADRIDLNYNVIVGREGINSFTMGWLAEALAKAGLASEAEQLLTAYWSYRNTANNVIPDAVNSRTGAIKTSLTTFGHSGLFLAGAWRVWSYTRSANMSSILSSLKEAWNTLGYNATYNRYNYYISFAGGTYAAWNDTWHEGVRGFVQALAVAPDDLTYDRLVNTLRTSRNLFKTNRTDGVIIGYGTINTANVPDTTRGAWTPLRHYFPALAYVYSVKRLKDLLEMMREALVSELTHFNKTYGYATEYIQSTDEFRDTDQFGNGPFKYSDELLTVIDILS